MTRPFRSPAPYFISHTVDPARRIHLQGAPSYFAFATAGVALSVVLQAGTVGITRRIREEQLTGTLEMLVAQPICAAEIALGVAGFPFVFAIGRTLIYLLLAALLLGLSLAHTNWPGLIVALIASGLSFTAVGVALAAVVLTFKRSDALGNAAVVAMSLLGGALYPPAVLSSGLRQLSYAAPTRYAFEAVRGAEFGAVGWLGPSLLLPAITGVALPGAIALFSAAIRHNIRQGSLDQY